MFQHQLQMVSFQCLLVAEMSAFSASFTKTFCLDHKCLYDASPKAINQSINQSVLFQATRPISEATKKEKK